jgi:haloalkane dehalogenase
MTSTDAATAERRTRPRRRLGIGGSGVACLDVGQGTPVVLLHGPGTSSALWEPFAAQLSDRMAVRCYVPDLPGWGDSDPLPGSEADRYTLAAMRDVVDELLVALDASGGAVLGGHGWGATLAFDRIRRHPHSAIAVILADAVARPLWSSELPRRARELIGRLRNEDRDVLLDEPDGWVDELLESWGVQNRALEADLRARLVDPSPESRSALLDVVRGLPIDGRPPASSDDLRAVAEFMAISDVPKLHLEGEPGWLLGSASRTFVNAWSAQRTVRVDAAHLTPLAYPSMIADAAAAWLGALVGAPEADD